MCILGKTKSDDFLTEMAKWTEGLKYSRDMQTGLAKHSNKHYKRNRQNEKFYGRKPKYKSMYVFFFIHEDEIAKICKAKKKTRRLRIS